MTPWERAIALYEGAPPTVTMIWVELQELLFRFNVRGSGALLFVLADQVGHRNQDREEGR